jgi:hypothetical protein
LTYGKFSYINPFLMRANDGRDKKEDDSKGIKGIPLSHPPERTRQEKSHKAKDFSAGSFQ